MQTKKRAKSVSFGKKKVEKEHAPIELEEKPVIVVHSHKVEEETDVTESYPPEEVTRTRKVHHEIDTHTEDDEPEEEYVSVARKEEPEEVDEHESDDRDEDHTHEEDESFEEEKEDEEEPIIEPAEDVLSKPFPHVTKEPDPLDEDEHPKIFADQVDDRYVEEEESVQQQSDQEGAFRGFTLPPEERRKKRSGGNTGFFIIVTFLAFLFGLSGIIGFYYISKYQEINIGGFFSQFTSSPTPTAEPTTAPTPTEASVDLEAYTIKVLNGSGTTGAAGKVKTSLIDAGFKVGSTGNADNSDYTQTEISIKSGVPQGYIKKLTQELQKTYSVAPSVQTVSDNPQGTDVIVTLGSTGAK